MGRGDGWEDVAAGRGAEVPLLEIGAEEEDEDEDEVDVVIVEEEVEEEMVDVEV